MHRHTHYSPCSKRMASCKSWLSLWVIVKAQHGVGCCWFFFLHLLHAKLCWLWEIQMVAVQTEVRKHICTQSSQPTLAGSSGGWEQRHDSRAIRTDVRHKQLTFDLNIYKNLEISYMCYVWEGDGVIYNLCTCCSRCLWLFALTWLSHKPGGTHHFGPASITHGHVVCG